MGGGASHRLPTQFKLRPRARSWWKRERQVTSEGNIQAGVNTVIHEIAKKLLALTTVFTFTVFVDYKNEHSLLGRRIPTFWKCDFKKL